jgi:[acyl-carrier-protein] S-malonyltransferase
MIDLKGKPIVIMFPGQGSQTIGMGEQLYATHPDVFLEADEVLGFPLSKLMFRGSQDELNLTENTQPAILTCSIAYWKAIEPYLNKGSIYAVLGHSVGEYATLVASGAISFAEALHLTKERGKAMQAAVPTGVGAMAAVLKAPVEKIQLVCETLSNSEAQVSIANFNTTEQIVVSGHKDLVDKFETELKNVWDSPFRFVPLPVSAPFHCPLMKPARESMRSRILDADFKPLAIPYIANVDAKLYPVSTSADQVKSNLIDQIDSHVLWYQSFDQLPADGVYLEVGSGKVLSGMIKRINRSLISYNIEQSWQKNDFSFNQVFAPNANS